MRMLITLTEVLRHGDWLAFCAARGYDEYCLKEGTASGNDEESLSPEEIERFGLRMYAQRWLRGLEP